MLAQLTGIGCRPVDHNTRQPDRTSGLVDDAAPASMGPIATTVDHKEIATPQQAHGMMQYRGVGAGRGHSHGGTCCAAARYDRGQGGAHEAVMPEMTNGRGFDARKLVDQA